MLVTLRRHASEVTALHTCGLCDRHVPEGLQDHLIAGQPGGASCEIALCACCAKTLVALHDHVGAEVSLLVQNTPPNVAGLLGVPEAQRRAHDPHVPHDVAPAQADSSAQVDVAREHLVEAARALSRAETR